MGATNAMKIMERNNK